ncbi:hypothetical protein DLAC_04150 [Tieghemostelium lacteum]|uniref:RRM domain-containing protein n=1 Tax=Tieghemostelium lacteum TaxID=361077 RepID=A0A151ZST6_TIELA|nr:hypothetical protein DLAC_04150 [Tieghemostelium lacteum]|eukprot:KYQ96844.1 hypothetical protein DLAC_04150 [Tieghemostelium lacteum]
MDTDIQKPERDLSKLPNISLDTIIKENRHTKRGYKKSTDKPQQDDNNNNTPPNPFSALESSLDSIVKSQKPNYIKKTQTHRKPNHHHNNTNHHNHHNQHRQPMDKNITIVIRNNNQYQQPHHHHHNNNNFNNNFNKDLIQNRGLFSRNKPHHHHIKDTRKAPITGQPIIDHTMFDPRGIKDYSQVKRPTTVHGRVVIDLEEKDDYDENVYQIKVSNLPPTIIGSDVASLFSPLGSLKDFDLNKQLREATVIFKRKNDALAAIERYHNVDLDNYQLSITQNFIIKKADKEDIVIQIENESLTSAETTTTTTSTKRGEEDDEEEDEEDNMVE